MRCDSDRWGEVLLLESCSFRLDRCLSLYFLTWKQSYGKLARTKYHLAILTVICLFLNSHILFLNGYHTGAPNFSIKCYATRTNPFYIFPQWERVHLVLYNLCPFSIMCLCNTYIIYVTIRSARIRLPMTGNLSRHRQISVMLILVTFAFVLLTLPSCLYFVFFRHRMPGGTHSRTYRYMVQSCLGGIQFTSHAINFFLYCFFTKNFRNELQDFLRSIFFFVVKSKSSSTPTRNVTSTRTPQKLFASKRYPKPESTLEHQKTGEHLALKDMHSSLMNVEWASIFSSRSSLSLPRRWTNREETFSRWAFDINE